MEAAKSMSKQQLAEAYGVTMVTLNKWIRRSKVVPQVITEEVYIRIRVFSPADIKAIFDKIGEP